MIALSTPELVVACLAVMVVLVFGNVVLRYAFNSGISVSDELSRWLFVWITFMGAVVAMREGTHLGTDISDRVLRSAMEAIYPQERLRHVSSERLRRYCLRGDGASEGLVQMHQHLARWVDTHQHD